jgi:pectate lyase
MAGAPKSTGIALFHLMLLAATASALPLLNSSVPDPAAVVADFHRYRLYSFALLLLQSRSLC